MVIFSRLSIKKMRLLDIESLKISVKISKQNFVRLDSACQIWRYHNIPGSKLQKLV